MPPHSILRGYTDVLIRGPCGHGRKVIRSELNFSMPGTVPCTLCNDHSMVLKMPEISPSANASDSALRNSRFPSRWLMTLVKTCAANTCLGVGCDRDLKLCFRDSPDFRANL
jgi:hypothetical protein